MPTDHPSFDDVEQRVLGVLVEKQATTPDIYPLTLNSLVSGCNQSTNRHPVTNLDATEIERALMRLQDAGAATTTRRPGDRALKYRHKLTELLEVSNEELAVLAVLLLRGAQTPGELRQRTDRYVSFGTMDEVESVVAGLEERGLVERLSREPGQSQRRIRHLLGGDAPTEPVTGQPVDRAPGRPTAASGDDAAAFHRVIRARRMVRNYSDQPIHPEILDRIVEAGRRAPSAGFSQGQAFVVVTDPETRQLVAELAGEEGYVAAGFDPWISGAPALVVLYVSEKIYRDRYSEPDKLVDGEPMEWPVPYWWVDAGASMENILLAAVAEGLAAGFLGSHAIEDISDLLGVPDHYRFVGIVTIGHPAPDRRSGSLKRGRKERSTVIHHDRWSDPV